MLSSPSPTKESGQRSIDLPLWLQRHIPLWQTPEWLEAERWRRVVRNQPLAMACRDTIIANILTLTYQVVARDPEQADEYREDIDYYTKLFRDIDDEGYEYHTEKILQDYLDIPFGGAAEIGREGDVPDGKVLWARFMDGSTLFPTWSQDFPVGQRLHEEPLKTVYFPKHAVARIYMSPRTEIMRRGWGMAPPEKIYLAIQLLYRGDRYYADLLLDTPEVGILDLGDMSYESAKKWLTEWSGLLEGTDPFKVPVLYEHNTDAKFISFTRSPTEMMFDKAIIAYKSLTAAGYGLSLSDVGDLTIAAATLAASIRQERRAQRAGVGLAIVKTQTYYNRLLPPHLMLRLIDQDTEVMAAKGRARLANSLAMSTLVDKGFLTPKVGLKQLIADGLITVPGAEKLMPPAPPLIGAPNTVPAQVGDGNSPQTIRKVVKDPVPPSQGGTGEITARSLLDQAYTDLISRSEDYRFRRPARLAQTAMAVHVRNAQAALQGAEIQVWRAEYEKLVWELPSEFSDLELVTKPLHTLKGLLFNDLTTNNWWHLAVDKSALVTSLSEMLTALQQALQDEAEHRAYEYGLDPVQVPAIDLPAAIDTYIEKIDTVNLNYIIKASIAGTASELISTSVADVAPSVAEWTQAAFVELLTQQKFEAVLDFAAHLENYYRSMTNVS